MRLLTVFILFIAFHASAQTELNNNGDYDYYVKIHKCISKPSGLECGLSKIKESLPSWHNKDKMTKLSITKGKKRTYNIKVTNLDKVYEFKGLKLATQDIHKIMGDFSYFNENAYPFTFSLLKTIQTPLRGMYGTNVGKKRIANGKIFISIHEENIDQPISLNFHWLAATPNKKGEFSSPYIEEEINFDFTSDI